MILVNRYIADKYRVGCPKKDVFAYLFYIERLFFLPEISMSDGAELVAVKAVDGQ